MTKMNIKSGDTVKIIAGKDKGAQGEVLFAYPQEGRVIVQGVNLVKKALRPTQANPNGGIDTREAPINVSNVMLVCPECGLPTRIGFKVEGDAKTRVCKKCGKAIS